jgi:hypothetical protein
MKVKNAFSFYGFLFITAVILFSTVALHAAPHASLLFWADSERNFAGNFNIHTITNIKLPFLNQSDSTDLPSMITTFMNDLRPVSSPAISSTSLEGDNIKNQISSGNVALAPEPVTLLILGTGLMGIALYRRLKDK